MLINDREFGITENFVMQNERHVRLELDKSIWTVSPNKVIARNCLAAEIELTHGPTKKQVD